HARPAGWVRHRVRRYRRGRLSPLVRGAQAWALHPAWFREDLERLFGVLATRAIRPRIAERISFDEVAKAHRRLEAGGLEGKLVLCPELRAPLGTSSSRGSKSRSAFHAAMPPR